MLLVPAASTAASSIAVVRTPVQAAIGTAARTAADTKSAASRVRRRGQRSTQVPAGRPISSQGSQLAAVSRATRPVLACRVDTATNGRATVVIAEPNPLIDSPAQNKPKFRVRSRPPTGLRPAAETRSPAASGSVLINQATFSPAVRAFPRYARPGQSVGLRESGRQGIFPVLRRALARARGTWVHCSWPR